MLSKQILFTACLGSFALSPVANADCYLSAIDGVGLVSCITKDGKALPSEPVKVTAHADVQKSLQLTVEGITNPEDFLGVYKVEDKTAPGTGSEILVEPLESALDSDKNSSEAVEPMRRWRGGGRGWHGGRGWGWRGGRGWHGGRGWGWRGGRSWGWRGSRWGWGGRRWYRGGVYWRNGGFYGRYNPGFYNRCYYYPYSYGCGVYRGGVYLGVGGVGIGIGGWRGGYWRGGHGWGWRHRGWGYRGSRGWGWRGGGRGWHGRGWRRGR